LQANDIRLNVEAQNVYGNEEENFRLVARPGEPEVLVLERTKRMKSKEEQFPPEGTIDFYEIY
jgi:hypothetical protein